MCYGTLCRVNQLQYLIVMQSINAALRMCKRCVLHAQKCANGDGVC